MNLSKRWLKDFVNLNGISDKEYAHMLTMTGSMVTGFVDESKIVSKVVVGEILEIDKHPDADKLQVCQVNVGSQENLQIVTAATNIAVGQKVPVALDGSVLADGTKIKKGKLRGVVSNGMFCSIKEFGVTVNDFPYAVEDGIFIIEEECTPGQDVTEAIGVNDISYEFEITSNRPDCLSVIGLARETAVSFDRELVLHTPSVKAGGGDISSELKSVEIQAEDLCYAYFARVVKDVKIGPSPRWMRERLRACGVRPINNIVDITNYVMLEYGQPMHAFDVRYIDQRTINIRRAKNGETITTLDDTQRTLNDSMLVIADANKPVAIAGVMGGEYSGIMDDTTTVVFESANFNGSSVRRTAKALGMRTDASARYEKGLDPNTCIPALERACELVELLGAGVVMDNVISDAKYSTDRHTITLDCEWINKFLDINLSEDEIVNILTKLDCQVNDGVIYIPTYRADLEHKADIAEEIARIYGYNNIPSTGVKGFAQGKYNREQKFEKKISNCLISQGLSEIMTYSFISPKYYDKICMPEDSHLRKSVVISNPLGEDTSIMRTTALPSLLEILSKNYNNRNLCASFFEIAKEYIPNDDDTLLPEEKKKVIIGMYGDDCDFFTIKGVVEEILENISISDYDVEAVSSEFAYHPGRCAKLSIGNMVLGYIGELHPSVIENYEIDTKVYAAEIDFNALLENFNDEKQYKPLPKFPAVSRDLAIICDAATPVITLEKAIRKSAGKLLESIELFDVYQGKQIEENKKSVAYSISLRSNEASLTNEDAQSVVNKIIKNLDKLGATLRS